MRTYWSTPGWDTCDRKVAISHIMYNISVMPEAIPGLQVATVAPLYNSSDVGKSALRSGAVTRTRHDALGPGHGLALKMGLYSAIKPSQLASHGVPDRC
jgi:hypothetical protein